MKNFKNFNAKYDKYIIKAMVEYLQENKVFFVANDNHFKMLVREKSATLDYTYNLNRWGFSRRTRNNESTALLSQYGPTSHILGVVNGFLRAACSFLGVEEFQLNEVSITWI